MFGIAMSVYESGLAAFLPIPAVPDAKIKVLHQSSSAKRLLTAQLQA
jgi:hypothetical protein